VPINEHSIAVAIADVMGKGIPAAIMMSWFRGTMRAYADGIVGQDNIREMISRLNKTACRECYDGEFITLFIAVIDAKKRTLTYCNCGHEPAIIIRAGQTKELNSGGLVLGINAAAQYEIEMVQLQGGDCLMLYTDGLLDAADFSGQLWGRDRLLDSAQRFAGDSAEQMVKNILGYRRRFVGLARQVDDTSLIIIKTKNDS
jgi:sigma-B regulation protein RsbU (phosphoserine phosphatase)